MAVNQVECSSQTAARVPDFATSPPRQPGGDRGYDMIEILPQPAWIASCQGELVSANRRLLDYAGKATGRDLALAWLIHRTDAPLFRQGCAQSGSSAEEFETELRLRSGKDAAYLWHAVLSVPQFDDQKNLESWLCVATQIERWKSLEPFLLRQQRQESADHLAGELAHDFNNLLVGIMGGASLAAEMLERDHPALASLEMVRSAANRAARLVHQLLDYSGKSQALIEPLDLSPLIERTCNLVRAATSRAVSFELMIDPELPSIEASANSWQQVLVNLLLNAAEAIGDRPGRITIAAHLRQIDEHNSPPNVLGYAIPFGPSILLEIIDSGCGMEKKVMAQIFDPAFSTKARGRGLGLAAVQSIVRDMHGAIETLSMPGRGTTFRLCLPVRISHASPATLIRLDPSEARSGRILVIDDQEGVRGMAKRALERAGHEIVLAPDGASGIEKFRKYKDVLDLVLLDLALPDMSGVRVARELREVSPLVPVIIASGYGEEEAAGRLEGIPVSGFIQKPFTSELLVDRVANLLRAAQPRVDSKHA
jgi:two-component system cell cycle sensor histidine kinase/response regulator CckA